MPNIGMEKWSELPELEEKLIQNLGDEQPQQRAEEEQAAKEPFQTEGEGEPMVDKKNKEQEPSIVDLLEEN